MGLNSFALSISTLMAKQTGPIKIEGTLGDLTFYKMNGEYYVKMKSVVNSKVLKTHDKYALNRMHRARFGRAAKLVKEVYRRFPKDMRVHGLFGRMVGVACRLLKANTSEEAIKMELLETFNPKQKELFPEKREVYTLITKEGTTKEVNGKVVEFIPSTVTAPVEIKKVVSGLKVNNTVSKLKVDAGGQLLGEAVMVDGSCDAMAVLGSG